MRISRLAALPLLLAAIGNLPGCSRAAPGSVLTIMYTPYRQSIRRVSADMMLPAVASNHSWYCVWIIVIHPGRSEGQPFVQGGLIRWWKSHYRLAPFVAIRRTGERDLRYVELPPLSNQDATIAHRVEIDVDARTIDIRVDDASVYRANVRKFFPDDRTYGQLGAEVSAPGDTVSGTIEHIMLQTAGAHHPSAFVPHEQFVDRGLGWVRNGSQFSARGSVRNELPSCQMDRIEGTVHPCP